MGLKTVWVLLFVSVLLVSFSMGAQIVKAESSNQGSSYKVVRIFAPLNSTYNSRRLTLEVTFPASCLGYSLNYDLDGKDEGAIPFWVVNPKEVHVVYEARGAVELPVLSDGSHRVTVTIECSVDVYGGKAPSGPFKPTTPNGTHFVATWTDTVYFTIDPNAPMEEPADSTPPNNLAIDSSPPVISNLLLENKTFTTPDVPLNFTVNENTSQVAYSLDGQENVTIAGNTTLTGLSIGAHNLTVYAWDEAGNVGAGQTISFTVTNVTSEPLQPVDPFSTTSVVAGSGVSAGIVGLGLLVYFRKRKQNTIKLN